MPELPEVEVTRRGIMTHIEAKTLNSMVVRVPKLRWPIPEELSNFLVGKKLRKVERKAKYLLLDFEAGWCIIHLGMSGSLRIFPLESQSCFKKHDHVDWLFENCILRLHDPRRFGAVLWHEKSQGDLAQFPLFRHLGVEPLSPDFSGEVLFNASRKRNISIKQFLLEGKAVVGVGNIYASESLFLARIHPNCRANKISKARYERLAISIVKILTAAIEKGGSTLKDFVGSDGQAGYFQQEYAVYGRTGLACPVCATTIKQLVQNGRSTFYCSSCQK